jgi:6-phosphogluconolactonase
MSLIEYSDREMMMIAVANAIAGDLGQALRLNPRASLCVPGGTTPGPIFDTLAGVALDWDRVTVFLNDERWVDEGSDRSNARLVRARLLRDRAQAAQFIPLWRDTPEPEGVLDAVAGDLAPNLPISVLLLGMGADMHTASLFPGADRLAEALAPDAPTVMALRAEAAGEPRITLTAHVLNDAMAKHLVITGDEKRAAYDRALTLAPVEAPVQAVLRNTTVHWAA